MTVNDTIILVNENIDQIAESYLELKREGARYKGCCPFHTEKTPSFIITPSRGMYKCFGCGKGGDAIHFIQEIEGVDFKKALEIGAKKLNLEFKWEDNKRDDFDSKEYKEREALHIVCSAAAAFFVKQLQSNKNAQEYLTKRGYSKESIADFEIGYAPLNNDLYKWAIAHGYQLDLLVKAGLVKKNESSMQYYDFFRNRIMFPIVDRSGKVIGFSGRSLDDLGKYPKYLNSPETLLFNKSKIVFGLNSARSSVKKNNRVYLVEGNFDVMRLYQIGVPNVVAPCGTALTKDQIQLLKQYSNNITLIYDGDEAGRKAIDRSAKLLIEQQCHVAVILLGDGEDPDDVMISKEKFDEYHKDNKDYLVYYVHQHVNRCGNPSFKSEFMKDVCKLLSFYDEPSLHEVYIEEFSKSVKPKKAWQDALKFFLSDKAPVEKTIYIPKTVSLTDFHERGFYADNGCYFFAGKKGEPIQKSNFTLSPLFHIESSVNSKRLYEVKNEYGITKVIEIPQRDLVQMAAFKVRIESLGNFLWWGSDADLNRLKQWLYEKTDTCKEVVQLGWQKDGFFAYGNGVAKEGMFKGVDQYGIVKVGEKSYYIPAFSRIFEDEENLFEFERRFIHIESNISIHELCNKFCSVFGDNGQLTLAFLFACLHRDLVFPLFDSFPMLNMFGPKGAGKNACAEALLYFFGRKQKVPNLHNTSKPALGDHAAGACNAVCIYDEYRNDLEMEKREFLKGLWGGMGRTRMNMDKDKKKETTSVDQGIIICGQQMATADIALYSRFCMLGFTQVEFSKEEIERYDELKLVSKRGLTHITNQILALRTIVKERLSEYLKTTSTYMERATVGKDIETRIFNNWLMVLAVASIVIDELLDWDKEQFLRNGITKLIVQNAETKKNDDLGSFWKIVEYMASSNILFDGGDFKLKRVDSVKRTMYKDGNWATDEVGWVEPKIVLWINTNRIFSLYKSQVLREGDKPLPDSTVRYYLLNSKAFICETKKESFKRMDLKTGFQATNESGHKLRTSTTALVFDYDMIDINIDSEEVIEGPGVVHLTTEPEVTPPLPF